MTKQFKPLLAEKVEDLTSLKYPKLISRKLDGIRCVILNGKAVSRKLKPIPNTYIREQLEALVAVLPELDGMDGEIMVEGCDFNRTQSAVMSEAGEPKFTFWAFDQIGDAPYKDRAKSLARIIVDNEPPHVEFLSCFDVNSAEDVFALATGWVEDGFEGAMLRDPAGPYKYGRSTLREEILLKVKFFDDDEGTVVGYEEQMQNTNEAEVSELGTTKRSSHKDGMVGKDTLGALVVAWNGVAFKLGTGDGLTQELRKSYWADKANLVGKYVKFKYQGVGSEGRPRFPVFLGFRDDKDL